LRSGTLLDTVQGAGGEQLIWVPKVSSSIQSTLLNLAHEQAGHRGGEATFYRLVSNGVSWVGMRAACEKHCTSCILCQEARAQPSKWKHGAMGDFSTVATASNDLWVMDFLGPLPDADAEVAVGVSTTFNSILVIVDHFSRLTFLQPCKAMDAKNVIFQLNQLIHRVGWPRRIRCDGGAHFNNSWLKGWCRQNGVQLDVSLPYHPQAQGVAERRNSSISHLLRIINGCGVSWASELRFCEWTLNSTYTRGTGATPYEAYFGMKPRDGLAAGLGAARPGLSSYLERDALAEELREAVATSSELALREAGRA
jgi:transposase InsO family protein